MVPRFLDGKTGHGNVPAFAKDFRDLPQWYALFGDRVVAAACFMLLQRKPTEAGNVENVRRGPAIASFGSKLRNDTLFNVTRQQ